VPDRADNVDTLNGQIDQVVRDYCETHLISFGSGSILDVPVPVWSGYDPGDNLTVTVRYPFRFLVFSNLIRLIGGDMGNVFNLQAVTVMRLE
jgi:hypothetical protein